jgi:hypothetical protein
VLVVVLELLVLALEGAEKGALPEEVARRHDRDDGEYRDPYSKESQGPEQHARKLDLEDLAVSVRNDDDGAVSFLSHASSLLQERDHIEPAHPSRLAFQQLMIVPQPFRLCQGNVPSRCKYLKTLCESACAYRRTQADRGFGGPPCFWPSFP